MKKQLITATSILLLAATGGAFGAAQPGEDDAGHQRLWHGGGSAHEHMLQQLTRRLELDPSQQQAVENAVAASRPEMEALRERASANREALRNLDPAARDHDARLQELATEKGAIETEMTVLHGRLRSAVTEVLTPRQQEQWAEISARMHDRHMKRERRHSKE